MAGTLPARRRRRLAPFPSASRSWTSILWLVAMGFLSVVRMALRPDSPAATSGGFLHGTDVRFLVHVKRADRLAEGDAADRLGQQLRHAQLPDTAALAGTLAQGDGVGDDQFVQNRTLDVPDGGAGEHRVRAVGDHAPGTPLLQRRRSRAQRARGIDDV